MKIVFLQLRTDLNQQPVERPHQVSLKIQHFLSVFINFDVMLLGQDFIKPYNPYIILNQFSELVSAIGSVS